MTLEICFDFISPFAYFGWLRTLALVKKRGLELRASPVVFGALLDHWKQRGPAEIPPKRVYTFKTVARYAVRHGIPIRGPAKHPFNSLAALRVSLREVSGARQLEVIDALYDAIWGDGIDGGDPTAIRGALDARGFDGAALLERTSDPAVKAALRASTDAAIARGAFGVPTIFAGDELFWGNDSLEWLELYLDGEDPLAGFDIDTFLSRPRGADRKLITSG